jgi:hypothetical protein
MKKKFTLLLLALVAAFSIAAGSVKAAPLHLSTTQTVAGACDGGSHFFAKTKFALHVGLAVASFKHFIYSPYRAGAFKKGAPGRIKALIKAGATGLFVVHELHIACEDAQAAGGVLAKVVAPLALIQTQLTKLSAALKTGHFNPSDITSVNSAVGLAAAGG